MVAQMPLEVEDGLPVIPVGIDGKTVRLIVDTGAERTTLTDAAVHKLKLSYGATCKTLPREHGNYPQ
jgi:predicted aspartyl protease